MMSGTSDGRQPTVVAMRAHLNELADDLGADLEEGWPGTPETRGRLSYGEDPARVLIPTVRDRRSYYVGLHEFGHLAAFRAGELRSRRDPEVTLVRRPARSTREPSVDRTLGGRPTRKSCARGRGRPVAMGHQAVAQAATTSCSSTARGRGSCSSATARRTAPRACRHRLPGGDPTPALMAVCSHASPWTTVGWLALGWEYSLCQLIRHREMRGEPCERLV